MIYTLTLNPSIDYVVHLDKFVSGITNRTTYEEYYIGGKGINVSCILSQLEMNSIALGFCGGFTGDFIENELRDQGICSDLIHLNGGISRINIKLKADVESEINGQGPHISNADLEMLFKKIGKISDGDIIVLAGSIPKTMNDDTYERIMSMIGNKKVKVVVDAAKKLLINCLGHKPFLIKPNLQELSEIFGKEMKNYTEIEMGARELMNKGARNVIVSLGKEGAILFSENGNKYQYGTVRGTVLNTVGSGDSMVAGFIAGYERTGDYKYALKLGSACGIATAFSHGLADRNKIDDIMKKL